MSQALQPSAALLCKLGSIVIHIEEFLSSDGHQFDRVALESLLRDPEVKVWISEMDSMAMLPKKRCEPVAKPIEKWIDSRAGEKQLRKSVAGAKKTDKLMREALADRYLRRRVKKKDHRRM